MRHITAFALLLLFLTACPPQPPVEPDPPPYNPDAAAACDTVCEHWRSLGCEEGDDSPGGEPCDAVCTRVQTSGIIEWNLPCRSAIESCDQIDSCEE